MPVAQSSIVIQERDLFPLSRLSDKVRTADRLCELEGAIQFGLLQPSEQKPQIIEELRTEVVAWPAIRLRRQRRPKAKDQNPSNDSTGFHWTDIIVHD